MTKYDEIKQRAQSAGGDAWIEEVLIRGNPDGSIKAGHVLIGWTAEGISGAMIQGVEGPYPFAVVSEDETWSQLSTLINGAAIDSLIAMTAERDALAAQLVELQQEAE